MTATRLRILAALGVACIASTVLLVKTAPPRRVDLLDQIYS